MLSDTVAPRRRLGRKFLCPHDLYDPFLAHVYADLLKLEIDPPMPISAFVLEKDILHESFERLSLHLLVGFLSPQVFVVSGSGWLEDFASHPDGAELAPVLFEEAIPYIWSCLKKAWKFFNSSFSRSRSAPFLHSFTIS